MINLNRNLLQTIIGKEYKILKVTEHSIKVIHQEAFNSVEWCEHKVAHMCKEWVATIRVHNNPEYNRKYRQRSGYEQVWNKESQCSDLKGYCSFTYGDCSHVIYHSANTEPEAIFKAVKEVYTKEGLSCKQMN